MAEDMFLYMAKQTVYAGESDFARYTEDAIRIADRFAIKLRLSEVQEELAGVYEDFDHLPTLMESVDEEELLHYVNNVPQSDEGD